MTEAGVVSKFIRHEAASSLLLGTGLFAAIVLANSRFTSNFYFELIHHQAGPLSIQEWVNDGLMAVFFYMVGMEIKRELISGSLSSVKKAMLPFFAALGGMIAPALIFSVINQDASAANAWGIPMATDIAFAVGALVVVGRRAPPSLRSLLLALAVIDDLGAILVIALFYSKGIDVRYLIGFGVCALLAWSLARRKYRALVHHSLGVVAWGLMLFSGVHATLAGVVWGFLTPDDPSGSPLDRTVDYLHPYVSFGILPLFALVNSGILLPALSHLSQLEKSSVGGAVAIGLFLGKPLGILLSSWICVRARMAELPLGIHWRHLCGMGMIAGIGFTMSLFIAQLSIGHETALVNSAKIGILAGSILSGLAGVLFLFLVEPRRLKNR